MVRFSLRVLVGVMVVALLCGATHLGARNAVDGFLGAMKRGDMPAASRWVDKEQGSDDADVGAMVKTMSSRMSWEIKGTQEKDSNTVVVETEVTNVQAATAMAQALGKVMQEAFQASMSGEEMSEADVAKLTLEAMGAAYSDPQAPSKTSTVFVEVRRIDGNWKISSKEENGQALLQAIWGDMIGVMGLPKPEASGESKAH